MNKTVARTLLPSFATLLLSCSQEPIGFSPVTDTLNWRTVVGFTTPDYVIAMWGTAPDNLYVTVDRTGYSSESPLIHFDGTSWTEVVLPSGTTSVGEISGTSATNIWVAGNEGLLHYDGGAWANSGVRAYDFCITQAGAAYAVARAPAGNNAVVRFNGASWDTLFEIPGQSNVRALWASDEPALVAAISWYPSDSLLWWDGGAARMAQAPGEILDFWGGSSGGLLAAGGTPDGEGGIWRSDGSGWIAMTIPPGTGFVGDMDGLPSNDVYAVSRRGGLLRFDGAAWQTSWIPTDRSLHDILVLPADLYVALGGGTLMHGSGGTWNTLLGDGPYDIRLLWAESPQRLVAVSGAFATWEWDDGVWTERGSGGRAFHGPLSLAGRAIDDLYAAADYQGILHYDGTTWSASNDTLRQVEAVAVSPSGTVFAIDPQAIYRQDPGGWTRLFQDYQAGLYSLWVGDGDEVFAGGFGLVQLKGDTVAMKLEIRSSLDMIRGISGVSSREVYFASERGLVLFDGNGLRPVGPAGYYDRVIARPDGTVLAVGYRHHALFSNGYWRTAPRSQVGPDDWMIIARDGSLIRLTAHLYQQRISVLDE